MNDDKRFIKTYKQGKLTIFEIWIDKETGVNYLIYGAGYGVAMTHLLDAEGKPVITPAYEIEELE